MSLLVADAMGLVCRAYHGSRSHPVRDDRGRDISAVVITERWLKHLMAKYPAYGWALAWDVPGQQTFRHQACADYKAKRAKHPSNLLAQLDRVRDMAATLGWDSWRAPGFEADDVIATLTSPREVHPAVIVSLDKDVLQLVRPGVSVLRPGGMVDEWEVWGEFEVLAHMGCLPGQVASLLALAGDTVDGIPGVKGVGKKRALAALESDEHFEGFTEALFLTRLRSDARLERYVAGKGFELHGGSR